MANTYTDLLKLRMPALGDIGWDDEVNDNTEIFEFTVAPVLKGNRIVSGLAPSDGGGLDIDVAAGTVVVDGNVYTLSSDTKTCTASSKNYLFVDDTGTLNATTTMPTGSFTAIGIVDTDITSIVRFSDARAMAQIALAMAIDYTPTNYDLDIAEEAAINQHLSGIDSQIGFMANFENKFINPHFEIAQLGTSLAGPLSDGMVADMWYCWDGSDGTANISQQAFTFGQTDVPGDPEKYLQYVMVSAASAGEPSIGQRIENVQTLAGKSITFAFYAQVASGTLTATPKVKQDFGTGGSPSSDVFTTESDLTITTDWQLFIVYFDIPAVSGKYLGTNNDDHIQPTLVFPLSSTFTFNIAEAGFFEGTLTQAQVIAKLSRKRPEPIEKILCERYIQKSYAETVAPGTITNLGIFYFNLTNSPSNVYIVRFTVFLKNAMRSTPTITCYSNISGTPNMVCVNSGDVSASVASQSESSFSVGGTDLVATTTRLLTFHWRALSLL